jgi:hypothetical protein
MRRFLLIAVAALVVAAALFVAVGRTDPPPITIELSPSSPITTSDSSGADVSVHVVSHLGLDVTCTPTSNSGSNSTVTYHFPVGTTPIHCQDTDGNPEDASMTVNLSVPDTTPPTVSVPSDITKEATSSAGAVVNFTVTATDNTDPSPDVNCTPSSGSTFPLGDTTVSCTASDHSGNTSAASTFKVTVHDTTAPSLTLPADISVPATSGAGAVVTYSASASDAVSGSVAANCTPASGSTFPIGSTQVNCSATDTHSNTANGHFNVTVTDTGGPQFSGVPADISVEAVGPAGAPVNYTAPSASDAIDGPTPVTCTPTSGSTFSLGTTVVTCSATDAHSNTATATFNVTVRDTTKPSLVVPANYTVYAETPEGISAQSHYPAVWLGQAQASDRVDPHPRISNDAPEFFTVGVHLVTFSASDASGNAISKSSTLEVLPMPSAGTPPLAPPPPHATPPNVTGLKADAGDARVRLSWQIPDGVDHVVISRALTAGGDAQIVYTGSGASFTDRGVVNGLEYRYVVISVNQRGDESAGVAVVALPRHSLLRSPKDGARLKTVPKLVWERNSEASYYNVQLFRGNVKILSTWPVRASFKLKRAWKFQGKTYKLGKGVYRWYVWPGFGKRSAVDYGDLLGFSTFQVVR